MCVVLSLPACSSLLFLQVDNRPCTRLPSTCFPKATEVASFLRAAMSLKPSPFPSLPELAAVIGIRGLQHEIGSRDEETGREEVKGKPTRPAPAHTHTPRSSKQNIMKHFSVSSP